MISSFLKIPGGTKSHQFPTKGASARNKAGKAPQHSSKKALDFWNNLHFCSLPIISPSFKQKKNSILYHPYHPRVGIRLDIFRNLLPISQGGGVEDSGAAKEREWRESFRSQGPGGNSFGPKESEGRPTLEGWLVSNHGSWINQSMQFQTRCEKYMNLETKSGDGWKLLLPSWCWSDFFSVRWDRSCCFECFFPYHIKKRIVENGWVETESSISFYKINQSFKRSWLRYKHIDPINPWCVFFGSSITSISLSKSRNLLGPLNFRSVASFVFFCLVASHSHQIGKGFQEESSILKGWWRLWRSVGETKDPLKK